MPTSVKIYLSDGTTEEHIIGEDGVRDIYEDKNGALVVELNSVQITFGLIPYILTESYKGPKSD